MFETLKKIKDNIEAVLGSSVSYWIDNPNLVILSELPIVAIAPVSTSVDISDNQRDKYEYTIDIYLIIDARQELRKFKQEVVGVQYLTEKMEAKDSTGALKENTILYILRHDLNLGDNWNISNVGSIDYATRIRGTEPASFVTKEAVCRIGVTRIKNR